MKLTYKVLIADDHAHAREGIRQVLEADDQFEIVGEACNGVEAVEMTGQWMPDLVLMDIHMAQMDGLEATKKINEQFPYVKIVMITVSDDIMNLFEALKRGAQGYLLKNLHPASWHEYLRAIAIDEAPISRELAHQILKEFAGAIPQSPVPQTIPLTPREIDILVALSKGCTNLQIADHLYISEFTVKNHLKNIMYKLHLENRMQLMRYAFKKGLVTPK